jgi:signal transduction histidine kinase
VTTVRDTLLIALFAFLGAAAAGLLGACVLLLIRRRSLIAHLAVVAGVGVTAMLAGTLAVAQAMFLSRHDLTVVTTVVAMAAVVSLATALLLGRWVAARSHALALAARSFGDGGDFTSPAGPATAELAALSRELEATSAKLAESRERERALESSRRELVAWISHDLRTPLAGLRAMAEALEDGVAADPGRYLRQIRTEVERLNDMVGDLFELSRIHAGTLALSPSRISLYDLVGDALAGADPLAREHGVRLVGAGVEPVPVEVDGKEMSRVLGNLLVNAIRGRGAVRHGQLRRHPRRGPAARLRHRLARHPRPHTPGRRGTRPRHRAGHRGGARGTGHGTERPRWLPLRGGAARCRFLKSGQHHRSEAKDYAPRIPASANSLIPATNATSAFQPSSARSRDESAVMCRTSPSRYSPVTTGSGPPYAAARARAISPTVCGSPLPVLYAVSTPSGTAAALASNAATLAAATSRTWTKSRRWRPSSKTRGASPRASAERKKEATPA